MTEPSHENEASTANPQPQAFGQHPQGGGSMPDYGQLVATKTWVDTLAWYLLVMGFIGILAGGLMFWLYKNGRLRYDDYVLNGNAMGSYFLVAGVLSYVIGRVLSHVQRLRRRRLG